MGVCTRPVLEVRVLLLFLDDRDRGINVGGKVRREDEEIAGLMVGNEIVPLVVALVEDSES